MRWLWIAAVALGMAGCTVRLPTEGERAVGAATVGGALLLSEASTGWSAASGGGGGAAAAAGGGAAAPAGGGAGGAAAAAAGGATSSQAAYYAFLRQLGGVALVAYALYDPLAPNWEISVVPEGRERVRLVLAMRPLATGGQGEAWRIFQRAAQQIVRQHEARDFRVVAYEEGVHSTRPFAQRYAIGAVELLY
ncbi:MAG: hypothetical protein N2557_02650 [Hydrogenophilus sp.]|nr:hypothetical protein [Hydrogenophilus sp.]